MTQIEIQAMESIKGIYREMKNANEVNWEQRRYEIAKGAICAMLSNPHIQVQDWSIKTSVDIADMLIAELKKDK